MKDIFPDHVETSKEKKKTMGEKILITLYDFFQKNKRLEKLLPFILAFIIYGMWKLIT
jgi:hypothetical protein